MSKKPAYTKTLEIPGLESENPFPAEYVKDFLTPEEADALFARFEEWLFCDHMNQYGKINNRKSVSFAVDTEHSQVRGTADEMMKVVDEDHCDGPVVPLKDAPPEVLALQKKLTEKISQMYGRPRIVNYFAINRYADETVEIGMHKHNEDNGIDTPTFIISTGREGERPFNLCLRKNPETKWQKIAEHGSLIVMPASYNDTHLHGVLKQKNPCGPRISVATKCLVAPKVFSLKSGWGHYPVFAKYVGCRFESGGKVVREGTIYGNDYRPFEGHGHPIAKTEAEFREYAEKKMLDPEFRAQAIKDLRGKHLLCWCIQDKNDPHYSTFCHARVWLELVNKTEAK